MSRSVGKVILGAACAGAAVGAVLHYMKDRSSRADFQNDFENFTDGLEDNSQSRYTTIPHTPQRNETAAS